MTYLKLVILCFWFSSTMTMKFMLYQVLFIVRLFVKKKMKTLFLHVLGLQIPCFDLLHVTGIFHCYISWSICVTVRTQANMSICTCVCFSYYNIFLLFADLCYNAILFAGCVEYKLFAMMTTF